MNTSKTARLLLVVPNAERGDFIRHLLRAAKPDTEIVTATQPDEAMRTLIGGSCAAAIAEGSDGIAIINALNKEGLDVPVIYIAPDDEGDLLDQAREAGASDAIFRSELSPATLQSALHYALLWHTQEAQKAISKAKYAEIVGMERTASLARLASSISHEVRNPLSLIYLATDLLAKPKPLTEEMRAMIVEHLRRGARRIEEITISVLEAYEPKEMTLTQEDPNEIIEEALHLAEPNLRASVMVRVDKQFGAGLPTIHADRERMVTAIYHLITNAIDAMPTGGDLVIKTSSRSFASSERTDWRSEGGFVAGDTAVIIEISDTGHGIPVDKLGRIFELFFTTKLAGQGTGLGLSTVQKIIQLHNGTINISNRPEGGVLARLTLKTSAA